MSDHDEEYKQYLIERLKEIIKGDKNSKLLKSEAMMLLDILKEMKAP